MRRCKEGDYSRDSPI
jgi:DNA-binding XRE family transcriptional regulator